MRFKYFGKSFGLYIGISVSVHGSEGIKIIHLNKVDLGIQKNIMNPLFVLSLILVLVFSAPQRYVRSVGAPIKVEESRLGKTVESEISNGNVWSNCGNFHFAYLFP